MDYFFVLGGDVKEADFFGGEVGAQGFDVFRFDSAGARLQDYFHGAEGGLEIGVVCLIYGRVQVSEVDDLRSGADFRSEREDVIFALHEPNSARASRVAK